MNSKISLTIDLSHIKNLMLFATIGWFMYLWILSGNAWLHPELLGTAAYIWANPEGETIFQLLRKVFDWMAFDPNVNRVRPLNDVVEVVDAVARPYLTYLIGPHPSLTPSAILTAILAPTFLYHYIRRNLGKASLAALMLCLFFISSTGFLSTIVCYIRPAKKLNLVFLCMSLYFGARLADKGTIKDFSLFYGSLLASFFSDELGLSNYVICGLLFWESILKSTPWKRTLYLLLPLIFLALTKWMLPFIYKLFSIHGAWDALRDPKKFAVFGYLLEPEFYRASLSQTARSFLSTIGIYKHVFWTELSVLIVLFTVPIWQIIRLRHRTLLEMLKDKLIISTLLVFVVSIYATLLDWYPFPHEISYLGSFNYYYHSSVVVMIILWLCFFWQNLSEMLMIKQKILPAFYLFSFIMGITIIIANFYLFQKVNKLVQIIHSYPFSMRSLHSELYKLNKKQFTANNPITFLTQREQVLGNFHSTLRKVFGRRWQENGFFQTFNLIAPTPIMSSAHINHLVNAYYPFLHMKVEIEDTRN